MIPTDFDYFRPDDLQEAEAIYQELNDQKRNPVFYSGGSEIISMSRVGSIAPGVVIDLKAIPECNQVYFEGNELVIGACVTLSKIVEEKTFPLLATTVGRIADHTNQCRITLGGNVCGTIIYRESVLPLLLTECNVCIYGLEGERCVHINEVFDRRIKLSPGEFITRFKIGSEYLTDRYVHVKKTRGEKIDYPLLTVAAIDHEGDIRAAFSGICSFPFRSSLIEETLNDHKMSLQQMADKIAFELPDVVINDVIASADYKLFVLKNTIVDMMNAFGGM